MRVASTEGDDLTLHICGVKCDHEWTEREQLVDDGWVYGESLRCAKCKALAVDQDMWGD